MQYVNIKTFQRDFFKLVGDLPITITKYGVPTFVLTSISEASPEKFSKKIPESEPLIPVTTAGPSKIEKEDLIKTFVTKPEWANDVVGFEGTIICEAPNQKCKAWATKRANFESPDHIDMTLCFCDEHLKALKKTGVEIFGEPEDL